MKRATILLMSLACIIAPVGGCKLADAPSDEAVETAEPSQAGSRLGADVLTEPESLVSPPKGRLDYPLIDLAGITYREMEIPAAGFEDPEDIFDQSLASQEADGAPPLKVSVSKSGNSTMVTLLADRARDDAIAAQEHRAVMERREDGLWHARQMGWRQKCWRNDTPDTWTTELCP